MSNEQCGGRRGERGEGDTAAHVEVLDREGPSGTGNFPRERKHESRPLEEEPEEGVSFLFLLSSRSRVVVVRIHFHVHEARRVSDVLVKLVREIDEQEERKQGDEDGLQDTLVRVGALEWG